MTQAIEEIKRICPKCGRVLKEEFVACPYCGYSLGRPRAEVDELAEMKKREQAEKEAKANRGALYAGIGGLICSFVGLFIFAFFLGIAAVILGAKAIKGGVGAKIMGIISIIVGIIWIIIGFFSFFV